MFVENYPSPMPEGGRELPSQPQNNINERAMRVQQADGIDVGAEWWGQNVHSEGTEEEMFSQFMAAYERDFPRGLDGKRHKKP